MKTIDINRSGITKGGFIQQSREHEQEKATPVSAGVNQDSYRFATDKVGGGRKKRIKVSLFHQLRCKHNLLTALCHRKAQTWPGCYNRDAPSPPTSTAARAVRTQRGSKGRKKACFVPDFSNHQESMACSQPAGPEGRRGRCQKRALELQQAGDARQGSGRTRLRHGHGDAEPAPTGMLLPPLLPPSALLAAFPAPGIPPVPSQRAAAPASHMSLSWVSPAIWIVCQLKFSPCCSFLWPLPQTDPLECSNIYTLSSLTPSRNIF